LWPLSHQINDMSAAPTPAAPSAPSRGARHQYRSRRGNHHNARQAGTEASTSNEPSAALDTSPALPPASVTPYNQQHGPDALAASGVGGHGTRGWSGRRGRPTRRGGSSTQTISGGGRAFGGQLTRGEPSSTGSLQAGAPEFRPGQPVQPRQLVICSTGCLTY